MKTRIVLEPVSMTYEVMRELEEKGLIYLLGPAKHQIPNVGPQSNRNSKLYVAGKDSGPHQLLAITKNVSRVENFGCHSENEEFLLIGDTETKPLYLLVGLLPIEALRTKGDTVGFTSTDFMLLQCRFNDPTCSFFTMLRDTPHTECVAAGPGRAPSFYVSEPSELVHRYDQFSDIDFEIKPTHEGKA